MHLYNRIQRGSEIAAALAMADPIYKPILDRMLSEAELASRAMRAPPISARKITHRHNDLTNMYYEAKT